MPGRFMNLNFHGAGKLTGEDVRLKEAAIDSKLVSSDAMDEAAPKKFFDDNRDVLLRPKDAKPDDATGMQIVSSAKGDVVTMNRVGREAFARNGFTKAMTGWLELLMKVPVDALVLGGHHNKSIVWGSEAWRASQTAPHRPFCALEPLRDPVRLAVTGYRDLSKPNDLLRAGPVEMTGALSACKLLIVYGCNGATSQIEKWSQCIKDVTGSFPFVLGWYGVHGFPVDDRKQFVSEIFWPELAKIAPNPNLDFVLKPEFTQKVLKVWFDACAKAFPAPPKKSKLRDQSHLIFSDFKSDGTPGPRGAAAIDPSGRQWKATDKTGNFQ
ncbi:MAG TPA: hypothetical protein VF787_22735 [Thermoanaerobaculia bacterium]